MRNRETAGTSRVKARWRTAEACCESHFHNVEGGESGFRNTAALRPPRGGTRKRAWSSGSRPSSDRRRG
ncbi:hypothetical protein DMC64_38590 [Amycolatopsis sp. WAC 04197]|nr:hypothetical protein DMC64_38590 [Amycolatopsis sp. WAC 04197]